jgi:hypothetical protein
MAHTEAKLREAFGLFDYRNEGKITTADMRLLMKGVGFTDLSEQETVALLRAMDTDNTGFIEFDEYMRTVLRRQPTPGSPEELWKAYQLVDASGNGITQADLIRSSHECGLGPRTVNDATLVSAHRVIAEDNATLAYEPWRCTMNNLFATTRLPTKL